MLLHVENLRAGYGDFHVLDFVSFEIGVGEMVAMIGPNGAGKSTVLRSIFGLTTKTQGRILFDGLDITRLSTLSLIEQGIGFVPQGRLVFRSLTVQENLEMGGFLITCKETQQANIDSVYKIFPALFEKKKEFAGNLSGGQQQQLAVGRALMTRPKLLLLDEPSLGLSPKLMQEVFEVLTQLQEEGMTLLIVEQNVRLVLSYADRGYLLSNGKIRLAGTAHELASEHVMRQAFLL